MSARPERLAQGPLTHLSDHISPATSPNAPRHDSVPIANASSALKKCLGAISLVDVTMHSLEAQQIAASEQEVLNQALRALRKVHDWIYDRMWPDNAGEPDVDRECRP